MPPTRLTGLVLAGGRSRRFGEDKALLELAGETLLERTVKAVAEIADEVLIVGRMQVPRALARYRALADELPRIGPLGGLLTGLRAASHDSVLTTACDLPFISAPLLQHLTRLPAELDAAVPRFHGRAQPLLAVYRRRVLPAVGAQIETGDFHLRALLARLHIWWLEEPQLRQLDPELRSFTNINVPADWQELHRLR